MPPLLRRMTARDTDESHRVSSPLELLFDLTFVVAISQAALGLAHGAESGHPTEGLGPFLMIFFAIWWAWMNFTWFASAFDTDDVPYRILTLLQMAGSLVIAAGVPAVFAEHTDLTVVTIGYAIARLALVAQWLRAAKQEPEGRRTALLYAVLITVVQALWLLRLLVPWGQEPWLFVVLALAEIAVPPIANRGGGTNWHPHHIAERYGLFVIILLGESVAAATVAFSQAVISPALVGIGGAGLVILFALWWLYFVQPTAHGLENRRDRAFFWGYGHYVLFAALAATGAGLEVAVAASGHEAEVSEQVAAFAVAIPVAVAVVTMWLLHAPLGVRSSVSGEASVLAAALVVSAAILSTHVGLAISLGIMALVVVLLVATTFLRRGVEAQ
jgi:low temperature requirement protein LtrA